MSTGKKIFFSLWAILTVIGWVTAPGNDFAFRLGYGMGYGIWVPVCAAVWLLGRKGYRWLVKE